MTRPRRPPAQSTTPSKQQAYTYKENFAVTLTKLDGTKHTIKNF
jgi:hypothetical protein